MSIVHFIPHSEVVIDPCVPVPLWPLAPEGIRRMMLALDGSWLSNVRSEFSGAERKATDVANLVAERFGLALNVVLELGGNDRFSTGYLPKLGFKILADTEESSAMNETWHHQVRLHVDETGRTLLDDPTNPIHTALREHGAVLVSQLDAFEAFVADPEQAATPLGRWTAATLADPEKRARHRLSIAVRIGGAEVYDEAAADALEVALRAFVEDGTLQRLSRHDTNPASNLPIPGEFCS